MTGIQRFTGTRGNQCLLFGQCSPSIVDTKILRGKGDSVFNDCDQVRMDPLQFFAGAVSQCEWHVETPFHNPAPSKALGFSLMQVV
jgi:hypothetical protein